MSINYIEILNLAYEIFMIQHIYVLEPSVVGDNSGNYFKIETLKRILIYHFIIKNELLLF